MNKQRTAKKVSFPRAENSFERDILQLVAEGTITSIGSEVLVPTRSLYDVSVERHLLADEHQVCFHCRSYSDSYWTQSTV